MKRKTTSYILLFLMAFQVISAVPVGFSFITDPSGKGIGIPLELLNETPFNDYLIPGLFLLIVLGFFPAFTLFGLITNKPFKLSQKLNLYKEYHWSWAFSYYTGLLLVLWINMQLFFGIEFGILHFVYSILGLLIIVITHLPNTRNDYKVN